jgi:Phosphotransferase enzyme family
VLASTKEFPPKVRRLAQQLSACDNGPFPLCHGDFGHNNIVVDDQYQVLGVIDWEDAYTTPWETIEYPLILCVTPRSIDLPSNWDAEGNPINAQVQSTIDDQQTYLGAVRDAEAQMGLASMLSATLGNMDTLGLATSMRLFSVDGKMGWYSRALDYIER